MEKVLYCMQNLQRKLPRAFEIKMYPPKSFNSLLFYSKSVQDLVQVLDQKLQLQSLLYVATS